MSLFHPVLLDILKKNELKSLRIPLRIFQSFHSIVLLACFLHFLSFTGCRENSPVTGTSDPVGSISTIYGVGYNAAAAVGWDADTAAVTQFSIYRHLTPVLTLSSAQKIASVQKYQRFGIIDTGLVNGTLYYYTVVPELLQNDGSVISGKNSLKIGLIPADLTKLTADQIIYSQHIQPVFTSGCAVHGCHVGSDHTSVLPGPHGASDLSLETWSDVMNGTDGYALIVPMRAVRSHLLRHINSDTLVSPVAAPSMPPGFRFPTELRDLFIRWIDRGAKNDDGAIPFSSVPVRGWAYVTNQGEDLTAVIDLDKNRIARYITTGVENTGTAPPNAPHNVTVDRQNQFYYVNLIGGSKLQKFRVSDNVKTGELSSGLSSPAQVALSMNGDTAYVTNFENAKTNITLVNTATMTVIGEIGTPAMLKPHGISITPDHRYVIVANSLSDNVTVIRTADNTIVKTIPIAANVPSLPVNYVYQFEPYQSAVTPDSKFAYVTCRKSGEVRVIDLTQMKVTDSIKVGTFPLIPALTPNGAYLFVTNRNSNSVSAINTATRTVEYTIANVGVEPHGIAVSKDGKFVYVSCENLGVSEPPHHATTGGKKPSFLKVIDIEKRSVVASLELGNFGSGMAVTQ